MCWLKKDAHRESFHLSVYLEQYEHCSPGDGTSDSSEKLFQRGRGEGQNVCDSGKGQVHAVKHIFFVESFWWSREASASHEKQASSQRILVLF